MKPPRILLTSIILFCAVLQPLRAQTADEYAVKASFITRFVGFIQWPGKEGVKAAPGEPFVISIFGEDPFRSDLSDAFRNVDLGGRPVSIRVVDGVEQLAGSKVVFISGSERDRVGKVVEWSVRNGALTIGDAEGFGEMGVIINFFLRNDKVRFEINPEAAEKGGFQISSLLLKVARIVGRE